MISFGNGHLSFCLRDFILQRVLHFGEGRLANFEFGFGGPLLSANDAAAETCDGCTLFDEVAIVDEIFFHPARCSAADDACAQGHDRANEALGFVKRFYSRSGDKHARRWRSGGAFGRLC